MNVDNYGDKYIDDARYLVTEHDERVFAGVLSLNRPEQMTDPKLLHLLYDFKYELTSLLRSRPLQCT